MEENHDFHFNGALSDLRRILDLPDCQVIKILIKDSYLNGYSNRTSLTSYLWDKNSYITFYYDNNESKKFCERLAETIKEMTNKTYILKILPGDVKNVFGSIL
jgi:muramoyltetrapeptide carboxypeptidase LdcA involved in peptidoglycan recycling